MHTYPHCNLQTPLAVVFLASSFHKLLQSYLRATQASFSHVEITPYEGSTCKKEKTITLHLDELGNHHHTYSQVSAEPSDLSLLPMPVNGGDEQLTVDQIHCQ